MCADNKQLLTSMFNSRFQSIKFRILLQSLKHLIGYVEVQGPRTAFVYKPYSETLAKIDCKYIFYPIILPELRESNRKV